MLRQVIIVFLSVLTLPVLAQKNIYKGDFEWQGEQKGTAEYEYTKDRSGKEIADGKFHFSLVERDSVNQAQLTKKDYSGFYKSNEKSGEWKYVKGVFDVIVYDVVDFQVKSALEAEVITTKGTYEKNLPKGKWEYKEERYKDEQIEKLAQTKHWNLDKGWFSGAFHFEEKKDGKNLGVQGFLTPNGFMDSVWIITYMKDENYFKEKRIYDKGILLDIYLMDPENDRILTHIDYEASKQKLKQLKEEKDPGFKISSNEFGLRFNNGYRRRDVKYTAQLDGNAYVEKVLRNLLQFDKPTYFKNGDFAFLPIKTRRFEYPAVATDQKDFEEIRNLYDEIKTKVKNQLDSKALSANKNKTDSLAFTYAFFQSLEEKMKSFENIVDIFSSGRIKYVDQSIYTKDGLEYLQNYDTIEYTFGGEVRKKVIDNRQVIESSRQLSISIKSYLQYENELIDFLTAYIYRALEQMEIDSSVSEFELKVLNKKEILDDLYYNGNFLSNKHEQVVRRLRFQFLDEEFKRLSADYDQSITYLQKVQKAEEMLKLLNDLDGIYEDVYQVFEARDEIDELYYENFFNAFTYSNYDQRAKERLYKHGNEKLFNHYVLEILGKEELQEIVLILDKIQNLQDKLRELRETDTRKMERKLRRNNKPQQIESTLGLK